MDVSIIIVNFNSGELLAGCLDSLSGQLPAGLGVEHIVVDSRSSTDQSAYLEDASSRGARVFETDRNLGYAGGCNRGLCVSSGRHVFFLNADVFAAQNCLGPMIRHLDADPGVGLIEPRTFLDLPRTFIIPEIFEPARTELFLSGLARLSARAARCLSFRRVQKSLRFWQATEPIDVAALSGAFLGTRREVMERIKGFDEGYPLFYEDTDLFRRVRDAGMRLVLHPGAEAVHLAHRSVATVWDEAMQKMRFGRERYIKKHMGLFTLLFNRALERLIAMRTRIHALKAFDGMVDLGSSTEPIELKWEGAGGEYLLEIALDPHFVLAAALFSEGDGYRFSRETWASFLSGEYYLRALRMPGLEELGCWKIRKV